MASKKTTLLLAGLAAGAYAYFKKPENREKAVEAFNSTKSKVNDFIEEQKKNIQNRSNEKEQDESLNKVVEPSYFDDSITGDVNKDYRIEEKEMVSEGALTSVQYENQEVQDRLNAKRDFNSAPIEEAPSQQPHN